MKILKELAEAKGFSSLLVLTYNLDLAWFEAVVCPPLRLRGVHRFVIFADALQVSETLAGQAPLLGGPGRTYELHPMKVDGAFHPKAYLLTGDRAARLYMGSGNLTSSGLNGNLEVFERWDTDPQLAHIPAAFRSFQGYVDGLVRSQFEPVPQHLREALHGVFAVPPLERPADSDVAVPIGAPGLFDRLPKGPSPAAKLTMLAPYFDAEGRAVVEIARRLNASAFEVWTDRGSTNLTPQALDTIIAAGGQVSFLDLPQRRRVHAKALYAEGASWKLAVTGSANLSLAAWKTLNAELVVMRSGESASNVETLLQQHRLAVVPATDADRAELERRALASAEEDATSPKVSKLKTLQIVSAQLDASREFIAIKTAAEAPTSAAAQLFGHLDPIAPTHDGPCSLRVAIPLSGGASAFIVRLRLNDELGPWVAVHNPAALHDYSQAASDEAQEREALLDAVHGNPGVADDLMQFLVEVHSRRVARITDGDLPETSSEKPAKKEPLDQWVWLGTDATSNLTGSPFDGAVGGPDSSPSATRILMRLLFGAEDEGDDLDEGESELSDAQAAASTSEEALDAEVVTSDEKEAFFDLAERARTLYLAECERPDRRKDAIRHFEDLEVLSVAMVAGLRSGRLAPHRYVVQQVRLLRALLGFNWSALPRSLEAVEEGRRARIWADAPFVTAVGVLIHNIVLADPVCAAEPALCFWLRTVVVHSPFTQEELIGMLGRQVTRLSRGALWLGGLWPDRSAKHSLHECLIRWVDEAFDLIAFEREARPLVETMLGKQRTADDDSDSVLGFGRDHQLTAGFHDESGARLNDGPFLLVKPQNDSRHSVMHSVSDKKIVPISLIEPRVGSLSAGARRGFELLKRLA